MERLKEWALPVYLISLALVMLLTAVGCAGDSNESGASPEMPPAATDEPAPDPFAQAAAEATTIVRRAEATAMVLQAEAQAAEMIESASGPDRPDAGGNGSLTDSDAPTTEATATPATAAGGSDSESVTADEPQVEIISVGFAGEGGFIHVQYLASPGLARRWNQGLVSVTDEESGHEYIEIPVMPKVGPLIGKPIREGQPGYVMFVNGPVPLQPGAIVTVKLGNYVEEGITVQG